MESVTHVKGSVSILGDKIFFESKRERLKYIALKEHRSFTKSSAPRS